MRQSASKSKLKVRTGLLSACNTHENHEALIMIAQRVGGKLAAQNALIRTTT